VWKNHTHMHGLLYRITDKKATVFLPVQKFFCRVKIFVIFTNSQSGVQAV
jgi:hypothetical protein